MTVMFKAVRFGVRGVLLAAVGLFVGGCGPWTPTVDEIATYRIDHRASAVSVRGVGGDEIEGALASELRVYLTEILNKLVEDRGNLAAAVPARFDADVVVERDNWPTFACLVFYTVFGCPTSKHKATVELTLQVGEATYRGVGRGSSVAGLYYNGDYRSTYEEAVREALRNAAVRR